jgi:hypothetical protein
MKLFASGSCRLLTSLSKGTSDVIPIHSMFSNFIGINFLGKLHNTRQHIQFIKYIKGELVIHDSILPLFLTSYNNYHYTCGRKCEDLALLPIKIETIRSQWDECEWFVFEICSLKLYTKDGFEVFIEHTQDYTMTVQTEQELMDDLYTLQQLIPNKKILFQVHFRPNIIKEAPSIANREIIYKVVCEFCKKNKNAFLYDPSSLLKTNHALYDGDLHFKPEGHRQSFKYMYDHYFYQQADV